MRRAGPVNVYQWHRLRFTHSLHIINRLKSPSRRAPPNTESVNALCRVYT